MTPFLYVPTVSAGPKCPEGKELIKLVKGQDVFDLEFGITDKNAYKALKGKMGVLVRNGDVLSIDADFQFFTAKKLCVTTKKATEVEFRFFGEGLEHISSKTVRYRTSCVQYFVIISN